MRAGIALGSNVGDRLIHLRQARRAIHDLEQIGPPEKLSRIYETEPVNGALDAGPFLNAVMEVEHAGHPIILLDALQAIEAQMGRPSKRPRNASRSIDIDLLYVGNTVLHNAEVVLPHPRLHLREFVLAPLAEIRAELVLPGQHETIAALLDKVRRPNAVKIFQAQWE